MLNHDQQEICRVRLESLRDTLAAQYEAGKSAAGTVTLDQTKVGRLSRMDALQQQNMAQSFQRNIESRLRQVHKVLAKFATGDYGYCDTCGNDIDPGRLEARPEAPCCLECQSRQETEQG